MNKKAYKIFKKSKSGLYKPAQVPIKHLTHKGYDIGVWYNSENAQPKYLKERPGFHCARKPTVPHIKLIKDKVVWLEVEISDYIELKRPKSQGGTWFLADKLKIIREIPEEERLDMIDVEDYNMEFNQRNNT